MVGGANGAVAYSTNGNASWTKLPAPASGVALVAANGLANGNLIYAASASSRNVYRWAVGTSAAWIPMRDTIMLTGNPTGIALAAGALYVVADNGTNSFLHGTVVPDTATTSAQWTDSGALLDTSSPGASGTTPFVLRFVYTPHAISTTFDLNQGARLWALSYDDTFSRVLLEAAYMVSTYSNLAAFSYTPYERSGTLERNPGQLEDVTFHATGPTGQITSYVWDFGDSRSASGPLVKHAYPVTFGQNEKGMPIPVSSKYTVTLTVRDSAGKYSSSNQTVEVVPAWRMSIHIGDILFDPTFLGGIGHAAIYAGNGGTIEAAFSNGVVDYAKAPEYASLDTWDRRGGTYLIGVNCSDQQRLNATQFARGQVGKTYSLDWWSKHYDPGQAGWYCSELVWAAYMNQGIDLEYTRDIWAVSPYELLLEAVPSPYSRGISYLVNHHGEAAVPPSDLVFTGWMSWVLGWMRFLVLCPVDLNVTSPSGLVVGSENNQVPGAIYMVDDMNDDGSPDKLIYLPTSEQGQYQISVKPDATALPTDNYTLALWGDGRVDILAKDKRIDSIPTQGYAFNPASEPKFAANDANNISPRSARLNGTLSSLGTLSSANVSFQWGPGPGNYGSETPAQTTNNTGSFQSDLSGLSPSTVYYYRAKLVSDHISYSVEKNFTTSSAPPPPGGTSGFGGSGGGGGAPAGPGVTAISMYTDEEGLFNIAAMVKSEDGSARLNIAQGIRARTREVLALKSIKIVPMESQPTSAEDSKFIGLAYEFTPEGATFLPAIALTISYDPTKLPQNINIDSLTLAVFNTTTSNWEAVRSSHDKANSTVTANIEHFSNYVLTGKMAAPITSPRPSPAPASFGMSGVVVSPEKAKPGQTVTISTMVSNAGGMSGEYEVTLKINGVIESSKRASLGAGVGETVVFTISKDGVGNYQVDVNGSTASFSVEPAEPTFTSVAPQTQVPAPLATEPGTNGLIIGIVAGALVAAGVVLGVLFLRRRKVH
jgi:hypothetical protein